jgi:hypothetical protein
MSSIPSNTAVIDTPWDFDSNRGGPVTASSLKQKRDTATAHNICVRKQIHAF